MADRAAVSLHEVLQLARQLPRAEQDALILALSAPASDAAPRMAEARHLGDPLQDRREATLTMGNTGRAHLDANRPADALPYMQQALTAWRELGDPQQEALALEYLAVTLQALGDFKGARAHQMQSLELRRGQDERVGMADSLDHLARLDIYEGDIPGAIARASEALTLRQMLHDQAGLLETLFHLVHARLWPGQTPAPGWREEARLLLQTALHLNTPSAYQTALLMLARVREYDGERERAAALLSLLEKDDSGAGIAGGIAPYFLKHLRVRLTQHFPPESWGNLAGQDRRAVLEAALADWPHGDIPGHESAQ